MLSVCEITDIFYLSDEFSSGFNKLILNHRLKENNWKKQKNYINYLL